jgi:hypothetical protein
MIYNASPLALATPPSVPTATTAPPLLGVPIGPDTSGSFAMSVNGLAIQRSDGRWVAKPPGEERLFDVTDFLIPGVDPMACFVPVESLAPGDITVVSTDPLTLRYVVGRRGEGEFEVLDPDTGDVTDFVPLQTPLLDFYVRVVSLLDFVPDLNLLGDMSGRYRGIGVRMGEERREQFALEEILPFLLLSQGSTALTSLAPLLLLSRFGGGDMGRLLTVLAITGALPGLAAPTVPAPVPTAVPVAAAPVAAAQPLSALALVSVLGMLRRRPDDERRDERRDDRRDDRGEGRPG